MTEGQISSKRVSMPEPIPCQRHLFDLPADVAYLNCAYMSPLLKRAAEVGADAIARKCQPWRIRAEDFFSESERARALFAELLGVQADDIALVPAASYGLAVAAANLPIAAGQRAARGCVSPAVEGT